MESLSSLRLLSWSNSFLSLFSINILRNFLFRITHTFLCFFHPHCDYIQSVLPLSYAVYSLDLLSLQQVFLQCLLCLFQAQLVLWLLFYILVQVYCLYLFWANPCLLFLLDLSFRVNSSILSFCLGVYLLHIVKACCVSCSWESCCIKKRPHTVQALACQEVFVTCAGCSLRFPAGQPSTEFLLACRGGCLDL